MSLPKEKFNSLVSTREFLRSLLDPKLTPKVPRKIRDRAALCLRHYPWSGDLDSALKTWVKNEPS